MADNDNKPADQQPAQPQQEPQQATPDKGLEGFNREDMGSRVYKQEIPEFGKRPDVPITKRDDLSR